MSEKEYLIFVASNSIWHEVIPSDIVDFLIIITEGRKLFLQFNATISFVSVQKVMRENG
jgi:hypothetical protein